MTARGRDFGTKSTLKVLTTNTEQYDKGEMVCVDTSTGLAMPGETANATLIPIGWCRVTITGTGTNEVEVELFDEVLYACWDNDGTNPVVQADLMQDVYISGAAEVSTLATGRSVAGKFIGFDPNLKVRVAFPSLNAKV